MVKTIILGNKPDKWWVKELSDIPVLSVPNIAAGKDIDISKFIQTLPQDKECIVIDADSLNPENIQLPLDIMLQIRLMLHNCRMTSLSAIIMVSDLGIDAYKGYGSGSMVLMTDNVSLVGSEDVAEAVDNASPLTPGEYVEGFLGLIKVEPNEKVEGRHSIANEWGAEVLNTVIGEGVKSSVIPLKTISSLYFKYSNVISLNAEDVKEIVSGKAKEFKIEKKRIIKDKNLKYLLIDDEASKGWDKVLSNLMPLAEYDVWSAPVGSYEEISVDIRDKIRDGKYYLIFLDLRMAGVAEENVVKPEDFSGMKILKAIKKVNRGIQVIMLTATNKAWNVKALLDAGADGYYMKESPEYHFPLKYSEQNAQAFLDAINKCVCNSYLQDIVAETNRVTAGLPSDSELSDNISSQLSIALSLILKARSNSEYAFAFISLEQVFEIATAFLIRQEWNGGRYNYRFTEGTEEKCKLFRDGRPSGYLETGKGERPAAQWKRVAAIYYQLYMGKETSFGENVERLISLRNSYIHPENGKKPVIGTSEFQELFEVVTEFLSVFK